MQRQQPTDRLRRHGGIVVDENLFQRFEPVVAAGSVWNGGLHRSCIAGSRASRPPAARRCNPPAPGWRWPSRIIRRQPGREQVPAKPSGARGRPLFGIGGSAAAISATNSRRWPVQKPVGPVPDFAQDRRFGQMRQRLIGPVKTGRRDISVIRNACAPASDETPDRHP
jgi:hypothetical protein